MVSRQRPSSRDRRGRGPRGPLYGVRGSCDLAARGVPADRSPGERFDALAVSVMSELWAAWPDRLGPIELGVEEVPVLPDGWTSDDVPLSTYVEATTTSPARIVLLRRPIEHRAETRADLDALVLTVLVDQAAEILGLDPEDVHPGYAAED